MLPSPRFSVASAFVPHLSFLSFTLLRPLSLLRRILLAPFHCPFSLLSLLTLFLCLLGVLFCSVFSDSPHLFCFLCFFRISLFSLRPLSLCFLSFSLYSVFSPILLFSLTLPCVIKRFPLTTGRKTITTCVENVLTLTSGDTEHDVLPLTPTSEFPPQDKPRHRPGVPCRTHKNGRDAVTPCFWKH